MRRKPPIGIQNFREIREDDCYYVDKTPNIRLSFLTGVSKFSKVSLFSGLNNLYDLTLDPRYSALCGYTESDLDEMFAPELSGLDRERIRDWYNGHNWLGEEGCTTLSTPCCFLRIASSAPSGSRPARRHFLSRRSHGVVLDRYLWRACAVPAICYRRSTWT